MQIFIPRLPPQTIQRELERTVKQILSKKLHIPLTAKPKLCSCTILAIRDNQGNTENHGLLTIQPDNAAQ